MPKANSRLLAILVSGCTAFSAMAADQSGAAPAAPGVTASASAAQLEQLLAPIALYPDSLLAQILMASTYPLEVVEAARWSKANPKVQGEALEEAMQKQAWDPSVKSLTAVPQVLEMMNEKLSWTQQLGDAFLADQQGVMKAVQKLRRAANEQGNLKSSKEQTVTVEGPPTETIIKIEPANPTVVYVPSYNPTVVYGSWPYPAYPPYSYYPPGYAYAPGAAFWTFTAGVAVGAALWGDCDWGDNDININRNNYNNFNRTNISNSKWNHNVDHRRGVSYKDQRVAQKYNRGTNTRDVQAREQFRGRAEAGRADIARGNVDRNDLSGSANRGDRGGASAGTRDRGGARDGGMSAGTSDVSRGSRDFSGGRQASSFGGVDSGRQAGDFSSRGASSRQSMSGGGGGRSFSGGGGGGGGRAGGGGGGRGGGGGGGGRR